MNVLFFQFISITNTLFLTGRRISNQLLSLANGSNKNCELRRKSEGLMSRNRSVIPENEVCRGNANNGHLDDVTLFQVFHSNKNKCNRSINHLEFRKYARFHKNLLQMHGNMEPQTCQILQRNVCQGEMHFFVKTGNFGVQYFYSFAMDS